MSEVKVADHFTITKDGSPHHIKMTFGLLNELVRTIGDIEAIGEVSFDIELRNAVLNEIFAERDEMGVITGAVNMFTLAVDPDEIVELLAWVGAHVTDFLLKQMVKTKEMMEARQGQMRALTPTSTGSPA